MQLNDELISEVKSEGEKTRRMLERVPENDFGWKPHEKSMTLGRLSTHIAELPVWITRALKTNAYNFSQDTSTPVTASSTKAVLSLFEQNLAEAIRHLESAKEDSLHENWKLLKGEKIILDRSRYVVIRENVRHLVHHRGQLTVYLRLQNVPLPPVYGPTADEIA